MNSSVPVLLCHVLLCHFFLWFCQPSSASELPRQTIHSLAQSDTWRSLLHYSPARAGDGVGHSKVDDRKFFLAAEGSHDPQAELEATLHALFQTTAAAQTLRCRYPARTVWLAKQFTIASAKSRLGDCRDYWQWRKQVNAYSATLVFAASYLNSPSSMYGHTFLRFDPQDVDEGSRWLSHALNFGANINNNDNSLLYTFRGLAGGYPGQFNMLPYYEKLKEYNRLENRDLWEYHLNLTPAEVDFMLQHVWELKGVNFDYYFLDENCSYRLLELFDLVRPGLQLAEQFPATVIPIDTVRVVADRGFIDSVHYSPSRLSKFEAHLAALTPQQQTLAKQLADDQSVVDSETFTALDESQQYSIIKLAYDDLRRRFDESQRQQAIADRSHQLLLALNRRAAGEPVKVPVPDEPLTGHPTAMVSVNAGQQRQQQRRDLADDADRRRDFQSLQFRWSYHDLLDKTAGYPHGASLNMGNVEVRKYADSALKLQRFDVLEITSLSLSNSFVKPWAWRIQGGWQRRQRATEDALSSYFEAGLGKALACAAACRLYGLFEVAPEYNSLWVNNLDIAAGLQLGIAWQNDRFNVLLFGKAHYFSQGIERDLLRLVAQWSINNEHALRLRYDYLQEHYKTSYARFDSVGDRETYRFKSVSLAYRYYF